MKKNVLQPSYVDYYDPPETSAVFKTWGLFTMD